MSPTPAYTGRYSHPTTREADHSDGRAAGVSQKPATCGNVPHFTVSATGVRASRVYGRRYKDRYTAGERRWRADRAPTAGTVRAVDVSTGQHT